MEKSAALPAAGAPGVLYLVDLSGYVFRAYHAIAPLSSSRGEVTHAVMGTVNMLQKVVNDRRPAMFAVAMDSRTPSFRKEIDPRYKATRPPAPPDLASQMVRCREIVGAYGIPIFQKDGLEADDLIAAATARALTDGMSVVVVSADKDLMQLVRDDDTRVVLWDSMRDRVYGPAEVATKFGVPPSQLRDLLALTGDTSDNVPGVPSVGPKTAADLLGQFGTLEGVYARLDEVKRVKLREALREHEADARLSQRLVTLDATAELTWSPSELAYGGADVDRLRELFTELEFHRLRDQLDGGGGGGGRAPTAPRGPSARSGAPKPAAAPPVVRTTRALLTEPELVALVADATAKGRLAVSVVVVGEDPMRAALVGLGLAATEGDGRYLPLAHRTLGAPSQLALSTVVAVLGPALASPAIEKCLAPGRFIEHVLERHGMPLAGLVFDPALAGYVLDPETPHTLADLARRELGLELTVPGSQARGKARLDPDEIDVESFIPYAGGLADAALSVSLRLGQRVEQEGMGELLQDLELPLARVLVKLERAGVLLDEARLAGVGERLTGELADLERRAKELAGHEFALRSRDQLETILFDELRLPVIKRTPKGGRSTDAAVLEELAGRHPLPDVIVHHRELDKLKGTYVDALPRAVNPVTHRIHTQFEQTVAATGRLSSIEPNLQNIPIRSAVGREIRSAFVAPAGSAIVSADYSQIELRLLAHLSEDPRLCEAFASGEDVHAYTASLVFEVPLGEVTSEMRRRAKAINFGVIYGMGDSALAKQLGIARAEAAAFIEAYFQRYEGVKSYLDRTVADAKRGETVRTLLGRRRFLPNLHSANRGLRFEAERVAKNTPIQGSAADLMKVALLALDRDPVSPGARMVLTVHDEVVFEVPLAEVAQASLNAKATMEGVATLRVPLVVDVAHGPNWAEAHG
ncbi:MAG: DNA polymerase I [Myxococcales bacterium]|nr:DNA polymerase I [Myxococcales bacterium]